jgi:adenylosuccinate lyase
MIDRYTRKKMGAIWSMDNRLQCMLDVEVAVAKVQATKKIIPRAAALEIAKKGKFKVSEVLEIEKTTKHDVIAFVQNVASHVGPHGRYVHFGLTSSDVLDTALALQIRAASEELFNGLDQLDKNLVKLALKHQRTLCAGRTHGMHAEITSFGVKMAGFLSELRRARHRINTAISDTQYGKLGGAVGNYTNLDPSVEIAVLKNLKLKAETVATQVIPRDRHAALFCAFSLYAGFVERLAVELRHLQRTELSEAIEDFTPGQKGSSAMPHKKNPITAENLTGMSRLLRGYSVMALENMALWHERDISHSSVERVILPDAFIVMDYATSRLNDLLQKLHVNQKQMLANIDLSQGRLFSSQLLLLLVKKGMSREDAYKIVQEISLNLKAGENLKAEFAKHIEVKKSVKANELKDIFSGKNIFKNFEYIVKKAIQEK